MSSKVRREGDVQSRTSAAARHSWASNRGRRRHVLSRFPHERPATPFSARARIPVRSRGQGCRSCNLPWLRILHRLGRGATIGEDDGRPAADRRHLRRVVCARSRGAAAEPAPHVDGAPQPPAELWNEKSFGTLLGRTAARPGPARRSSHARSTTHRRALPRRSSWSTAPRCLLICCRREREREGEHRDHRRTPCFARPSRRPATSP